MIFTESSRTVSPPPPDLRRQSHAQTHLRQRSNNRRRPTNRSRPGRSSRVRRNPSATTEPLTTAASSSSECATVFLTTAPAADPVGTLCTKVDSRGTSVSGVTITFTAASSCSESLMLRVSGADETGAEFGEAQKVTCNTKKATASFTPTSRVAPNTFLCGVLLADKYTAAQACVPIP